MKKEGNLILFFGCFVNGRLKLHQLTLQSLRLKVDEIGRSIHNKLFGFNQKTQKYANQPSMSSKDQSGPKKFGERFRDDGLIGALRKKVSSSKGGPNEMHFLEHLEELRWVVLKCFCAFIIGCLSIAVFMQDSVKVLQVPLIKAVEDFGEIGIDLQSVGLEEYVQTLEKQEVDLGMLRNAEEEDLGSWGITNPHHQTRILTHFASGQNRNLLQVIRSYSPIFIAMKICFLGGLGVSLPAILYFIGGFVVPGLTPKEKRVFFPGCVAATLLFIAGASMTYLFILPVSLAFTIEFTFNVLGLDVYRPEAGNYYSTVIWMTFAVGIAFQFPLVLVLLIRIGILSVEKLRDSRRLVLVILMISAALITPGGDPVSLCILTIPLYVLYELAIIIGSAIERRKAITEWKEWDENIQGPKPEYPRGKGTPLWVYAIFLVFLAALTYIFLKYQDTIQESLESLSWGTVENIDKKKVVDSNETTWATENLLQIPIKENQPFFLQLIPVQENNDRRIPDSNQSEPILFKALIIKNQSENK